MRALSQWLWLIFNLNWFSGDSFNLFLEFWRDLINVFRSNQNDSLLISSVFESSLSAFGNCCCQDVDGGRWELRNVLGDSDKHS